MIKKIMGSGLNIALVKYIIISAVFALLVSFLTFIFLQETIYNLMTTKKNYEAMLLEEFDSLQNYINKNNLSSDDSEKILEWNLENWYTYIKIYDNNKLIYNSLNHKTSTLLAIEYRNNSLEEYYSYDLAFKDKTTKVEILTLVEFRHKIILTLVCVLLGTIIFISVFLLFFSRKIKYITEIENGIDIIKNGSLEYRLEVKGNDEIASLAQNINEMSETLSKQIDFEEKIKNQNDNIIAMLSHDIRTPLTSVICYLDLIADCKYNSSEKLQLYVKNARTRAYQIRNLTEDLFAYSVEVKHESVKNLETVNANEFLSQLLFENSCILEDDGFTVEVKINIGKNYSLVVDVLEIRRIIDNMSSNISKYADKKEKITFFAEVEDNQIKITQINSIADENFSVESYGIGLNSCKNILKNHNGSMLCSQNDKIFKIEIFLPFSTNQ